MPADAEIIVGIDICGESLKARLKTRFSFFFQIIRKSVSEICIWAKSMPVLVGLLARFSPFLRMILPRSN